MEFCPMDKQKFMSLEPAKRDRIINAAMSEFRYGYAKASTDAIVQKAGISKGLLFHYFGTKEGLYSFLIHFATDVMQSDYFDMLNLGHRDILEAYWQVALLKRDISDRYPSIYDFLDGVYVYRDDIPNAENADSYIRKQEAAYKKILSQCDMSKFRDDVNPEKAVHLIWWAIDGFFDSADLTAASSEEDLDSKSYEKFLGDLRGYLDILRLCFYKE